MAKALEDVSVDLRPVDRLEEKIKLLIHVLERSRQEQARLTEENLHLNRELDGLRVRLSEAESVAAEMKSLREERDVIRGRVAEMLEQLETLQL
jgi:regulator of replication initiation timing